MLASLWRFIKLGKLNKTFVKVRQRDGSGTAKKLEESITTAPSGSFIYDTELSNFIDQRHLHVSHAGRHYCTLSFCFIP
jgi:hypothetical protein